MATANSRCKLLITLFNCKSTLKGRKPLLYISHYVCNGLHETGFKIDQTNSGQLEDWLMKKIFYMNVIKKIQKIDLVYEINKWNVKYFH